MSISGNDGKVNTAPDKYLRAEIALRLINASGHVVSDKNKVPIYPSSVNWPVTCLDCNVDTVMWAWREWGDGVRGPGAFMGDNRLTLDFDPFAKVMNGDADDAQVRKVWRDDLEAGFIKRWYGENSRSLTGKHFVCAVAHNFAGRRGIELLKKHFAIDVLTGPRYCDITGDRINDIGLVDGTEIVGDLLTQVEAAFPDDAPVTGRGGTNGKYPIACLREFLEWVKVDLNDRDGWVHIGICLHTETGGLDAGLGVWDDWSRATGGEKYTGLHDLAKLWKGFNKPGHPKAGKLTVGTIIRRAKEGGADVSAIMRKHGVDSEAIADGRALAAGLGTGTPPSALVTFESIMADIDKLDDNARTLSDVRAIFAKGVTGRISVDERERIFNRIKRMQIDGAGVQVLRTMWSEQLAAYMNTLDKSDRLKTNRYNEPISSTSNILKFMGKSSDIVGLLAFDEFTQQIEFTRQPPWRNGAGQAIDDNDITLLTAFIETAANIDRVSRETVLHCISVVAGMNVKNSMRDSLNALKWDGVVRNETWLIDYCGVEDTPFVRAIGRKWLESVVARVMSPGCKADCVLTLESGQGAAKDKLLSILAGGDQYTLEFVGKFDKVDDLRQFRGKLIIQLAEGRTYKGEIALVKSGISRTSDEFRDLYENLVKRRPRQFGFASTHNEQQYLNDPSGARRIWSVACGENINTEGVRGVAGQLWAEAVNEYRLHLATGGAPDGRIATGHHWWIDKVADPELWAEQAAEADIRQLRHPWFDDVERYVLNVPSRVEREGRWYTVWAPRPEKLTYIKSPYDILEYVIEKPKAQWTDRDAGAVGHILGQLGYKRKPVRPTGSSKNEDRVVGWWLEPTGNDDELIAKIRAKQKEFAESMRKK